MKNVDFMLVIFKSQTITWLRTRVRKYNLSALGTYFGCEGPGLNVITWTLVSDHPKISVEHWMGHGNAFQFKVRLSPTAIYLPKPRCSC